MIFNKQSLIHRHEAHACTISQNPCASDFRCYGHEIDEVVTSKRHTTKCFYSLAVQFLPHIPPVSRQTLAQQAAKMLITHFQMFFAHSQTFLLSPEVLEELDNFPLQF